MNYSLFENYSLELFSKKKKNLFCFFNFYRSYATHAYSVSISAPRWRGFMVVNKQMLHILSTI